MNLKDLTKEEKKEALNLFKIATIDNTIKKGLSGDRLITLINHILPVKVSTKVICNNEDHISQLDYLIDVLINRPSLVILWANRGGSKTYLTALINWLESLIYKNRGAAILGGSGDQSKLAYEAMNDFWKIGSNGNEHRPLEKKYLKKLPLQQETEYINGSHVKIQMASETSVRGSHQQVLNLDEIDVMKDYILESALSQPQAKSGLSAMTHISSTNHVMNGNMDTHIERARSNPNAKIFRWCIWDCLESCIDYSCSTCPLIRFCPGEQMKQADGYYKIVDFLDKLRVHSLYTIHVEWFCDKIGSPDLVYKDELDEDIHFIDQSFTISKMVYLSMDWGGAHPFVIGVYQDFTDTPLNAWVRVDEIHSHDVDEKYKKMGENIKITDNQHMIREAKKRPWWDYIEIMVCDPSRTDLISEWNTVGIRAIKADNRVDIGISKVKGALKPTIGKPKIYFNKQKCPAIFREFHSYKVNKKGVIIKENDHCMDELRYFVMYKVNPINKDSKGEANIIKSGLAERMNQLNM
jgi:hypothetical protein